MHLPDLHVTQIQGGWRHFNETGEYLRLLLFKSRSLAQQWEVNLNQFQSELDAAARKADPEVNDDHPVTRWMKFLEHLPEDEQETMREWYEGVFGSGASHKQAYHPVSGTLKIGEREVFRYRFVLDADVRRREQEVVDVSINRLSSCDVQYIAVNGEASEWFSIRIPPPILCD